ncbi:hypothetical protein MB901379_01909 [Mycobacterium basiliense]|uniref:Uncharacterized protein n=1 Tax=Mycobacterium basiliense TaxID=2094119 RepID=A0A3S5CZP7_9MYCO|nr:hypothetical protein MB901379_01909 [Mycobacterium basiliense]
MMVQVRPTAWVGWHTATCVMPGESLALNPWKCRWLDRSCNKRIDGAIEATDEAVAPPCAIRARRPRDAQVAKT